MRQNPLHWRTSSVKSDPNVRVLFRVCRETRDHDRFRRHSRAFGPSIHRFDTYPEHRDRLCSRVNPSWDRTVHWGKSYSTENGRQPRDIQGEETAEAFKVHLDVIDTFAERQVRTRMPVFYSRVPLRQPCLNGLHRGAAFL